MVIHKRSNCNSLKKTGMFSKNEKLCKHPIIFMLGLHNAVSLICLKHMYKGIIHMHAYTHTHTRYLGYLHFYPHSSSRQKALTNETSRKSFLLFGKSNDFCDKLQIKLT